MMAEYLQAEMWENAKKVNQYFSPAMHDIQLDTLPACRGDILRLLRRVQALEARPIVAVPACGCGLYPGPHRHRETV